MSQTVKIFVFVCLAFLIFITAKGQLKTYLGFFAIGRNGTGSSGEAGESVIDSYGKTGGTMSLTDQAKAGVKTAQTVYKAEQAFQTAEQTITANNGAEVASGEKSIANAIAASGTGV